MNCGSSITAGIQHKQARRIALRLVRRHPDQGRHECHVGHRQETADDGRCCAQVSELAARQFHDRRLDAVAIERAWRRASPTLREDCSVSRIAIASVKRINPSPNQKDEGCEKRENHDHRHARHKQFCRLSHVSSKHRTQWNIKPERAGRESSHGAKAPPIFLRYSAEHPGSPWLASPRGERIKRSDLCGDNLIRGL